MNTQNLNQLAVGDVVSVPKAGIKHVGIFVFGGVLHNSPGKGERLDTFEGFAAGKTVTAQRMNADPNVVEQRARAILQSPRAYDLVWQNCDHTVSEVLTGVKESPQLGAIAAVSALVVLVFAIFGSPKGRAA